VTLALRSLHWLRVKQRIELKIQDLIEKMALVPGRASNRTAGNNDLVTRRTGLKLDERALSVTALRIWNQLPIEIKAATDTQAFKGKLKTHLLSAACQQ